MASLNAAGEQRRLDTLPPEIQAIIYGNVSNRNMSDCEFIDRTGSTSHEAADVILYHQRSLAALCLVNSTITSICEPLLYSTCVLDARVEYLRPADGAGLRLVSTLLSRPDLLRKVNRIAAVPAASCKAWGIRLLDSELRRNLERSLTDLLCRSSGPSPIIEHTLKCIQDQRWTDDWSISDSMKCLVSLVPSLKVLSLTFDVPRRPTNPMCNVLSRHASTMTHLSITNVGLNLVDAHISLLAALRLPNLEYLNYDLASVEPTISAITWLRSASTSLATATKLTTLVLSFSSYVPIEQALSGCTGIRNLTIRCEYYLAHRSWADLLRISRQHPAFWSRIEDLTLDLVQEPSPFWADGGNRGGSESFCHLTGLRKLRIHPSCYHRRGPVMQFCHTFFEELPDSIESVEFVDSWPADITLYKKAEILHDNKFDVIIFGCQKTVSQPGMESKVVRYDVWFPKITRRKCTGGSAFA